MKRRHRTATERDLEGMAARKEREAAPDFECEDVTGRYEGAELQERRDRRKPTERIRLLEQKHDSLVKVVTETRVEVAAMSGKLDILPELVSTIRESARNAQAKVDREDEDRIDARKTKRDAIAKIVVALASGAALGKFLHWLGVF